MHETWTRTIWKVAIFAMAACFIIGFTLSAQAPKMIATRSALNLGHVEPSGSYNTRIYVTTLAPANHTQKQNDTFTLSGYVTVANTTSGKWEPWTNVSVALKMNNSFIYQSTLPGSIVKATTNATGNFTLNYRVMFNQTAGSWNITAGLSPISNYNYTYNASFAKVDDVNITADVIIPQAITYAPAVFFNNDPFTMTCRLLTHGNVPVVGKTVIANFGPRNITSTATNATGHFMITVSPALGASYGNKTTLKFYFLKSGFYNALTINNFTTVKFLNGAKIKHVFVGEMLLNNPANPKPRNTTLAIEGILIYNATLFGAGDGYVKAKQLFVRWITNASVEFQTNITATDNFGHYLVNYKIPLAEPAVIPSSKATIKIVLDTTPATNNFTQGVYVRPQIATRISAILSPIWRNESIVIRGTLMENEPPTRISPIAGYQVNVTLWNGATRLASSIAITNSSGDYAVVFAPQNRDFVNYTVSFPAQGKYLPLMVSGAIPIYKTAVFIYDPGMKTSQYQGYQFNIYGTLYARGFGPDRPMPFKYCDFSWNGTRITTFSTDAAGKFNASYATGFSTPPGSYIITLRLRGFNFTGYSVATNKTIMIIPLQLIIINVHPSIYYPIFTNEPLYIQGNVTPRVSNMEIAVDLIYMGPVLLYDIMQYGFHTDGGGNFFFSVLATSPNLEGITIIANPREELTYSNASFGPVAIHFIPDVPNPAHDDVIFDAILIDGVPLAAHPSVIQGSTVWISGHVRSNLAGIGPYPIIYHDMTITDQASGGRSFTGMTDVNGYFSINVSISGNINTNFSFTISLAHYITGVPIIYTSVPIEIPIIASPVSTWVLWLLLPIIAGVILASFAYVKYTKKLELQRLRGYMEQKLDLVRELVKAGKFREAISYCYHVLVQVATRKYDLDDVKESCTVREFIEMLVTEKGISRDIAFPFMTSVLESIYGRTSTLNIDQVANAVSLLGNLYMDITKDMTQSFRL